jgi:hypothetical protein
VLALEGPGHPLLRGAVTLVRGVGATWAAASKASMPPPGSDWRVWLEWADGRDPGYAAANAAVEARMAALVARARPRFDESHQTAIRFFMARTGRDIVGELRRGYEAAVSDSARLVFGTMLQKLGDLQLSNAEIADALASGDPARSTLGQAALRSGFRLMATALPPDTAAPFIDRLIAVMVDSGTFWRSAETGQRPPPRGGRATLHAAPGRVFVNGDNLPDAVRAKWASRLDIISRAEWNRRDPRQAALLYTFTPVRRWGRFVRVEVGVSERTARPEGHAPAQYASGNTYYLMDLNGEWVVVAWEGFIT